MTPRGRSAALVLAAALFAPAGCTGLKTGTCGQEGQACCTGQVCEALLVCGASNSCEPCGRALGACCPGDVCGAGLACGGGVCADPSCSGACLPNSKRCSSTGGIEACVQVGACADWSALLTTCPSGSDCVATGSDAECKERCPGACTLDALVCSSVGQTKCQLDNNTNCPALFPFADDPTAPVCLAGACEGNWCWESPTPQGTSQVAIDGWAIDQFWTVDAYGNILRRDGNGWTYEHRAQPGKAVRALSQCGSLQGYLLAAGDNGTVLRRVFGGTWVEESVGDATAQLFAISCVFNFRAFAVGASGKVFVRDQGTSGAWRALASTVTAALRGAAYYYFTGDGWAVGDDGTIVRCRDLNAPATATCSTEASTVSTRLDGVVVNGNNGDVAAVGAAGVVLLRLGAGWVRAGAGVTNQDLVAVAVADVAPSNFVAVGSTGTVLRGNANTWLDVTPAARTPLAAVFMSDENTAVAVGAEGALWFNRTGGQTVGWNALGGIGPVLASVNGLSGLAPDSVWAAGSDGGLFRRHQAVWAREAAGAVQGELLAVAAADGGEVFAVGDTVGDVVLAGSPGRWAAEPQGTSAPLFGVLADDVRAVAVGGGGAWVERPRGPGGTWTAVSPPPTQEGLYAVAGRVVNGRATEVTAVGGNCTFVTRHGDGGFTEAQVPGCSGDALLAVWQGADGELLVAGENAFVARRLNGVWSREYLGNTLERVLAVSQSGARSFAACENGELYVRNNGTWQQELPRFTGRSFKAVWTNGLGDAWVGGSGGMILRGR